MSWDFLTESRLKLNVPSVNDFKQITGIEPASPAWEAGVLPMNYICMYLSISLFLKIQEDFQTKNSLTFSHWCLKTLPELLHFKIRTGDRICALLQVIRDLKFQPYVFLSCGKENRNLFHMPTSSDLFTNDSTAADTFPF